MQFRRGKRVNRDLCRIVRRKVILRVSGMYESTRSECPSRLRLQNQVVKASMDSREDWSWHPYKRCERWSEELLRASRFVYWRKRLRASNQLWRTALQGCQRSSLRPMWVSDRTVCLVRMNSRADLRTFLTIVCHWLNRHPDWLSPRKRKVMVVLRLSLGEVWVRIHEGRKVSLIHLRNKRARPLCHNRKLM